jgi:hypothetical protein
MHRFIDHLYTSFRTANNYSTTANLHNSQITTAPSKPSFQPHVLIGRSLATASNSGDSSASRAQVLSSQPLVQSSTDNWQLTTNWVKSKSKSKSKSHCDRRSVSKSWCRAPSRTHDQKFITVWQLRSCFCWAPSLTRGRVCLSIMLLALANAVLLGSESLGTRDHILLSQIWDVPFRRLLRLAGPRWRYWTPPPHGFTAPTVFLITTLHGPSRKYRFQQ